MTKPPRPESFLDFLKYGGLGLEMGAAVVIGLLIGLFLDRRFSTAPWMTFLFLGIGFAAAVKALWRVVRQGTREDDTPRGPEGDR